MNRSFLTLLIVFLLLSCSSPSAFPQEESAETVRMAWVPLSVYSGGKLVAGGSGVVAANLLSGLFGLEPPGRRVYVFTSPEWFEGRGISPEAMQTVLFVEAEPLPAREGVYRTLAPGSDEVLVVQPGDMLKLPR